MSRKLVLYNNMLDAAGAVVTPSNEDAALKFYYAYDRDIGYPAAFGTAASPSVVIDQGAAGTMVPDRLIISEHNFTGMTLNLKYSPDNVDWSGVADTWTQADGSLINRQIAAPGAAKQYWGIFWSGNGSTVPQMTEIFLGPTYQMERNPSYGDQVRGLRDGVLRRDLTGGAVVRYDQWAGLQKKYRKWPLSRATDAMAANINALDAAWAGKRPFWVQDDDGTWFFAELLQRADQGAKGLGYSEYVIEMLEVLPV